MADFTSPHGVAESKHYNVECIIFLAHKQAVRFIVYLATDRIPLHSWEINY